MKKLLLILTFILCGVSMTHAQYVDSVSWRGQGRPEFRLGKGLMVNGAITTAVGSGLMLLATSPALNKPAPEGAVNENMGPSFRYVLGMSCAITGAALVLAGVPVTVAGHSMMHCDGPWRDARYDARGLGVLLEGGYYLPDVLQMRASLGYHFNSHLYLGAGAAPGIWLNKSSRTEGLSRVSIPLYADFRWSIQNRMTSPYLGVSAGLELTDTTPYLGMEVGLRVRTGRTSTRSLWSAFCSEVSGSYSRIGIKMGYSF